ncbi:uncharacterized protein ACRADG_009289 [Cochliomyia hominivorax]
MNITVFQNAYSVQPKEINILVVNALRFVMQNVFPNIANSFVVTISSNEGPLQFWLHDIMGKLFASFSFMAVQLFVLDRKINHVNLPGKRYCNLIMIDSFASLEKTSIADYNRKSDTLEYYFIFLQTADDFVSVEMRKIFKYCFDNYWIHCNVMVQNRKGEVLIYTYFPFKENQCFQTEAEIINEFKGDRFVNEIMFPDKLRNLHECSLKLTTWIVPPFITNRTNKFLPKLEVSGFEIFILMAMSNHMNFTLDIDVISFDTYHQNKTPETLPMEMLRNFMTNITVGYFRRTAERDQVATPSYVTYYLPLVAVILRKQSRHESLRIFTSPFDSFTWTLAILFYGFIILLNNVNLDPQKVNSFQIYEIIIGMSVVTVPKGFLNRINFLTVLLSSFFIRSVYQSLLFYIFRTYFFKSTPISLQGLVDNGYKAVCTEMSLSFLENVPQIQDKSLPVITIYTANEMYPFYYLELYGEENYAAISIYDFALYYAIDILPVGEVLLIIPITVNDQQISFYLAKHSYLVERFNDYILWFQQAGLLYKWKDWSYFDYRITKSSKKRSTSNESSVLMVNLNQLIGFYQVVLLLYFISFAIFLLELLSSRIKWLRRLLGKCKRLKLKRNKWKKGKNDCKSFKINI